MFAELRAVLRYTRGRRGQLLLAAVLGTFGNLAALTQPLLVGRLIDGVGAGTSITVTAILMVTLALFTAATAGAQQYVLGAVGEDIVRYLRKSLAKHMFTLPIRRHDQIPSGDLVARISSDPVLVRSAVSTSLVSAFNGVIVLVGAICALVWIDLLTFSAAIGVSLLSFVFVALAGKRIRRIRSAIQASTGSMGAEVQRTAAALRVLRAYNALAPRLSRISDLIDEMFSKSVELNRLFSVIGPLGESLTQISYGCAVVVGAIRVAAGAITFSEFVSFLMFFSMLAAPINSLTGAIMDLQEAVAGNRRLREIMDAESEGAAEDYGAEAWSEVLAQDGLSVTFDSVSFEYVEGIRVLDDVSFVAAKGKLTAIVGPSGAGKSTALALIERFFDPSSGSVKFGGVDISRIAHENVRSLVGFVDQGSVAISGSLRENLNPSGLEISDDRVYEAMNAASLGRFVERLDGGLDQQIGEGGLAVSGGERQRIAIARALLTDRPILVLDEPTSSLDGRTEGRIRGVFDRAHTGTTVIVVAHRLSTVREADEIVVLDEGRVIDIGSHSSLLRTCGLYRDLAGSQLVP